MLDLACSLPRAQPQGTVFNYSTAESSVLGAVVAAATGRTLADYCAETIWGPAGMEAEGCWMLDADGGQVAGGFGVSACLRDLGRFGLLALEDGAAFSGRQVLPSGWRRNDGGAGVHPPTENHDVPVWAQKRSPDQLWTCRFTGQTESRSKTAGLKFTMSRDIALWRSGNPGSCHV
jgi:CubicO group peptidase (beta-lactamase class C family)